MSTKLLAYYVVWKSAIQDAEEQLIKAPGARASVLTGVIATFKEKLRRKEAWPGQKKPGAEQESVPVFKG
jgi:hypothetical protein